MVFPKIGFRGSSAPDVFVSRKIREEAVDHLESNGLKVEVNEIDSKLPKDVLIERTKGKKGLICLLNDEIDRELIEECEKLEAISNIGGGVGNIDINAAKEHNITITYTPGVMTEATADHTFALLLGASRKIPRADEVARNDEWGSWEVLKSPMGINVHEKTLGIVGLGQIGQAVAKRADQGFDMDVIYIDKKRKSDMERELGCKYTEFNELLQESDFVTIHVPLNPETKHMFGEKEFKKMKKNAILVNTADGGIIDEKALAKALKNNEIRAAAIDTFENEPIINSELKEIKNKLILTPHIGAATKETAHELSMMAAKNLIKALKDKKTSDKIN
ncbi:MAG: Phosphoglycerate dehydrogenase SerA [Candidatus Methanohalarchaeum thermophilum]|uniref:Phosphoglycerate dehydrogenase SerA n=1 Tax=Methanohalarchaeum thermophilum TaxID=1903181 RepID=A0A1Q6DT03_METT1|nr:MAG: Phosphoglycerate dehydrogenase SerA [Candidatus Methanohalarchaeum thermophilum]